MRGGEFFETRKTTDFQNRLFRPAGLHPCTGRAAKTQPEGGKEKMNEKSPASVPFYAHEAAVFRLERQLHLWQALAGIAAAALLLHKSSH